MIMVTQPRGHHVLPNQDVRATNLPPDRREPLGGRATPAAGLCYLGATRSTPAVRPTRCPPGLGGTLRPVRSPPLRSGSGPTPDHHHPPHRAGPRRPATLATDRVPAGHQATAQWTPLRVRRRAGDLPDRPAPS